MKTVLTGIKPTGQPHLGNYFGAIRPALTAAQAPQTRSMFFVANYHSLTSLQKAEEMRAATFEVAATWLAAGLDPRSTLIYLQSDVPEIFELAWVLSCFTPKGFMNRAHAYKAKLQENEARGEKDLDAGVSMGLFSYPVLMAADILLFAADEVPVGEDQVQHVEFARDIAGKFNKNYGEILKLPKARILKDVATVPGLDGRKMSKSYQNTIPIFAPEAELKKLCMRIKTDSLAPEAPKDPANSLLMDYYRLIASASEVDALTARYQKGIGWGEVKTLLFERINEAVAPMRLEYERLMRNRVEIEEHLNHGAAKARAIGRETLDRVRSACGVRWV
jgi:tryptophanyl-tRNA synthetase